MGYCTRYTLATIPDDILEIWEEVKTNESMFYAVGEDGDSGDFCKWYEHEEDMVEFSKKFPNVTFALHGVGEENGDIWNKYFRNGKKQICMAEITIPPLDENRWI